MRCGTHSVLKLLFGKQNLCLGVAYTNDIKRAKSGYFELVYTTQVNSTFCAC